ncbi:MAG: cache domain-containing protein [Candidatus Thorarchaeota archaeon]
MAQTIETKKKGSFRRNVILTFVTISILSLGATGAISYFFVDLIGDFTTGQSTTALDSQIQTNMLSTAEKTAEVINQTLTNAEAMVLAMAEECERVFRSDSTFEPREVYYDYFFEYGGPPGSYPDDTHYDAEYDINVSWNYSSWYVPGSNSSNYAAYEASNSDRLGRVSNLDFMFQAIHQQIDFRWLYLTFADNSMFINYPGSVLGGSDLDRQLDPWYPVLDDWYTEIEAGDGNIVFVEPYYDPIDGVLLISIGKTVHYENGTLIGVIAGDITIEDINNKILDIAILDTGYAALVEQINRGVVAHPDVGRDEYIIGLPRRANVESNNDGSPTNLNVDQVVSGQTGALEFTKDGDDYLLVYTPIGKANWICVIVVPLDEVLEAIPALESRIMAANTQATFFILSITVLGILVAASVAVAISNQITRPLQYMMDLATKNVTAMIRQDPLDTLDLQVDVTYTSKDDEIGELARAFQGMLDSIREDESS